MIKEISTKLTSILSDQTPENIMVGKERYPIVGSFDVSAELPSIMSRFAGLNLMWNCIDKAEITHAYFPSTDIVIGSTYVISADNKSSYGHAYNPPYEFHAWLEIPEGQGIIDFALPGVIIKGMTSEDEAGPFIVGREPFIIAGQPPDFVLYKAHRTYINQWYVYSY